jgi:hypothetical protein
MNWKQYLKRTGLKQADVIRAEVDALMEGTRSSLPPVAARWCGKVRGPHATASNAAVAKAFKK